ncbi:hypothetical protein ACFSR9_10765 [Deinococcus taklimakanensis]|uniref:Uncharacterized protein n=1 Tax=Deinococcus taklimakanensis TaxID=536443 RepID=A0ABW5P4J3_9DEIO
MTKETRTGQPTDASQTEVIEEGMQGADGNMDANGLNPGTQGTDKLEELKDNLSDLSGDQTK